MSTGTDDAVAFFAERAGLSYRPDDETPEEGMMRTARALADAEARMNAGPYYVTVTPDDEPWDADVPWDGPVWIVTLRRVSDDSATSEVIGSLCGVGCDDGDPYLRVVAAQLAHDHIIGGGA